MWNRQLWDVDSQEVIKQVKPIPNATGSGRLGHRAWTLLMDNREAAVMLTCSAMTQGLFQGPTLWLSVGDACLHEGFYFGG